MRNLGFMLFLLISLNMVEAEQPKQTEADCRKSLEEKAKEFVEECKKSAEWAQCLETQFSTEFNYNRNAQALKKMGYRLEDAARRISQEARRRVCAEVSNSQEGPPNK
jgi:hypothetical protein